MYARNASGLIPRVDRQLADLQWRAHERAQACAENRVMAVLLVLLSPMWCVLDLYLAPEHLWRFSLWRGVFCLAGLVVLGAQRRIQSPTVIRRMSAVVIVLIIAPLCVMSTMAVNGYVIYVFGLSMAFWGMGTLMTWPRRLVRVVLIVSALSFAGALAAPAAVPRPISELAGAVIYISSSMLMAYALIAYRRRVERRAFETRWRSRCTNIELASTLESLAQTQQRLVESEKAGALGRLLAGLSHEINNPLTVVHNNIAPLQDYFDALSGYIETLDTATDLLPRDQRSGLRARRETLEVDYALEDAGAALDAVATAVARIRGIHQDLRAFVRGPTQDGELTEIDRCVSATLSMLKRGLPDNVKIEASLGHPLPVPAHAGQLNQVIHNLLSNAVDAVGADGRIVVATEQRADRALITVTDDGPGVAESAAGRLFEPFFTTKPIGEGTGLGLAVSYDIIARHGGELFVDPSYRDGARFVVSLPAAGSSS